MNRASLLKRAAAVLLAPSLGVLSPAPAAAATPTALAAPVVASAAGAGWAGPGAISVLQIGNVGPKLWPELLENFRELARMGDHDMLYVHGHGWFDVEDGETLDPLPLVA